ncbi:hypothetical protein [Spiroplasma endosymbiont of Polydrusus formosus]|uniref:hypothetical protein n=1 Tax=Spiroplasma endosymbiont of Polydrusus formosus TaxID=3139326 RepID=UPI0035B5622E
MKNPAYRHAKLTYIDKLNYTYLANNYVFLNGCYFNQGVLMIFLLNKPIAMVGTNILNQTRLT